MNADTIRELVNEVSAEPVLKAEDIPDLELYVDQVTTLMENKLGATRRHPSDKIMTKTMINNYSKEHLLPESNKKKYSRKHLLLLQLIYHYKSVLSISDIHTLLDPLIADEEALIRFYQEFVADYEAQMLDLALETDKLETLDTEDLRPAIASLLTRAAIEKHLAERMIDLMVHDKEDNPPL